VLPLLLSAAAVSLVESVIAELVDVLLDDPDEAAPPGSAHALDSARTVAKRRRMARP
jgi:hypothetical protein